MFAAKPDGASPRSAGVSSRHIICPTVLCHHHAGLFLVIGYADNERRGVKEAKLSCRDDNHGDDKGGRHGHLKNTKKGLPIDAATIQ